MQPSPTETPRHTNRLSQESSPYLLQHRHNPVDWYAWGPEAFAAARTQNKPIFLSVGYSTCYWCHVMERQSFENEAVATEMNARFINIKVDREERPDVDALYMTAVQLLTRQGGWPMSVFLTPDLRPFYGGTYYPPTDSYGRPGFVSLLRGIDDAWRNRPDDVEKTARQLQTALRRLALPPAPDEPVTVDRQFIDRLVRRSIADYEPHFGGFGHAPKFPRETLLELLLTYMDPAGSAATGAASPAPGTPGEGGGAGLAPDVTPETPSPTLPRSTGGGRRPDATQAALRSQIEKMLRHTLDAMAHGGIRDQLGGGFHRYSTDAKWLVPHFEIMLYDNAMLGWVYTEAFRQFGDRTYAEIARGIFDFILREMTAPDGAFYTAFDAEVDAQEGMPYLWTKAEIEAVLCLDDAARFNRVYGVDRGPNFADPHHGTGTPDKNILYLAVTGDGAAPALFDEGLKTLRQKLYDARRQRKQPLLDTKILTSWNALMIRALAWGGQVLEHRRYIQAAEKAAGFLLSHHRTAAGGLYRTSRDGAAKYNAFLDDHSFLAQALLALAEASGEPRWADEAAAIASVMKEKFRDADTGGFYFTDSDATDLIVRQLTASDSPLPSGNAVAAMVLLETGQAAEARAVLATFAGHLDAHAEGMSSMVQAALLYLSKHAPFTVSAQLDAAERPLPPAKIAEGVVKIKPHWTGPTELHVRLTILDGFHINAHDPQGGDVPLVPTNLTITDSFGAPADVDLIDYSPGEERAFAFTDKPIRVYSGDVVIAVRFKGVTVGDGKLQLGVSYQPCDESACLPAVTKTVEVEPK